MNPNRLNWRFLIVFVVAFGLTLAGYFAIHARQVRKQSDLLPTIAERYAAEGKTPRALRTLTRYLINHPEDNEARLRYARLLISANPDPVGQSQALEALAIVLAKDPTREDLRLEIARILVESQKWNEAKPILEQLEKSGQNVRWVTESLGRTYAYLGLWGDVERILTPLCMSNKSPNPADYARLAEAHRRLNANSKADAVMEKLIKDHGSTAEAFLIRYGYRDNYKIAGSDADLDQAKRLAPTDSSVASARATKALDRKDPNAAVAELKEALQAHPEDVKLLRLAASAEAFAGRPRETVKLLKRASSVRPMDGELALNVAQSLVDVADWPAARTQLEVVRGLKGFEAAELDLLSARLKLEAGDWSAAMPELAVVRSKFSALKKPTQPIDALLARCAGLAGDVDAQINYAREAASAPNPAGRLIYASSLAEAGRLDEAADIYRLMLRDPKAPASASFGLAQLLVIKLGSSGMAVRETEWAEVEGLLKRAGEAAPTAWEIPVLQAEALLTQGKTDAARKILENARKVLPKERAIWAASAAAEARAGHLAEGEALLAEGKKQAGDSADLRLTALRIRFGGKNDKSTILAEAGVGIDAFSEADKLRIWSAQAEGYELINKPAQTAEALDKILAVRSNDLRTLLSRFDAAIRLQDEEVATRILEEIRRLEGSRGVIAEYVAAYRIVREIQAKKADKSRLPEARKHLAEVASRKPRWGKAALMRAEIEELDGNSDRAAEAFQEAFDNGERSFALLRRLVDYYTERRRFKEADDLIKKIQEKGRLNPAQSRAFAEIYLQAPDYARALELAKEAVDVNSKNPDDFLWLARVGFAAGRPAAEVEGALRQATTLAGDSPGTWSALVGYLKATNRTQDARQVIAQVESSAPRDKVSLILAPCYEALGEEDKAEAAYLKAIGEKPTDLRLAQGAASFFTRNGRWGQVEKVLSGIVGGKIPASPADILTARRDLAVALGAMGRANEALPLLDQNNAENGKSVPSDSRARAVILSQNRATQRAAFDLLDAEFSKRQFTAAELFLFARLAAATEQFPRAKEAMLALLGVDTNNGEYLAFWVDLLLSRNDLADSRFYLSKLSKTRPDTLETVRLQSILAFKQGRQSEAAERLRNYEPKTVAEEAQLSAVFEEVNDFESAEKRIREYARKLNTPLSRLTVSRYLGRRSRYVEALDIAESIRKEVATDLIATVAQDFLRSGEKPAEAEQVRRVEQWLAEAPAPKGREWQPIWLLAELADIRGDRTEAIARYRKALALEPTQPFIIAGLARLLCLTGGQTEFVEAANLAALAVKQMPGNADELLELEGLALLKQKQTSKAIENLLRVMNTSPSQRGSLYLTAALLEAGQKQEAGKVRQAAIVRGIKEFEWHPLERQWWSKLSTEFAPNKK